MTTTPAAVAKKAETGQIGANIGYRIENDILTLTIDLKQEQGMSKSGKNKIIASSLGNASMTNGVRIGLNVYRNR